MSFFSCFKYKIIDARKLAYAYTNKWLKALVLRTYYEVHLFTANR